jgi:metallo-beta-lactamase family protein
MCEAGRILHHLKHHIDDPATTVMFAGYQAPHTLGRKILNGAKEVPILGANVRCRAHIDRIDGCSAHADRNELLQWAAATKATGHLSNIFLVHGEPDSAAALADGLNERQLAQIEIPQRGDTYEL